MSSSTDPNIKINITTPIDLSGVDKAKAAIADLKGQSTNSSDSITSSSGNSSSKIKDLLGSQSPAIKSATDGVQKFTEVTEDALEITTDLSDCVSDLTKKSPAELGKMTSAVKTGTASITDQIGSVTSLVNTFGKLGRIAGTAGLVYEVSRTIFQGAYDYANRYEIEDKRRLKAAQQRYSTVAKVVAEQQSALWQGIEQADNTEQLNREAKAVDRINKQYQQRLAILSQISAAKQLEIETDSRILSAQREQEKSIIRQKVLAGQMTEAQGARALANVDQKQSSDRREQERKSEEQAVIDAQNRAEAARENLEKLNAQAKKIKENPYRNMSGSDYLVANNQANIARKNSIQGQEYSEWIKKNKEEINKEQNEKGRLANDSSPETEAQKNQHDINIEGLRKARAEREKTMQEAKASLRLLAPIEESVPVSSDYKTAEQYVAAVADALNRQKENWEKTIERQNTAQDEIDKADAELVQAKQKLASHEKARASEQKKDASLNAESNQSNSAEIAAKNLATLSEAAQKSAENLKSMIASWRASDKPFDQKFVSEKNKSGQAVSMLESIATKGHITILEAQTLNKLIKEGKAETNNNQAMRQYDTLGTAMRTMLANQRKVAANTGGAEQIKTAKSRYAENVDSLRNSAGWHDRDRTVIDKALDETRLAIKDDKLSADELASLNQQASALADQKADKFAQQAASSIFDALKSVARGQNKKANQNISIATKNDAITADSGAMDLLPKVADNQQVLAQDLKKQKVKLSKAEQAYERAKSYLRGEMKDLDKETKGPVRDINSWGDRNIKNDQHTNREVISTVLDDDEIDYNERNDLNEILQQLQRERAESGEATVNRESINLINSILQLSQNELAAIAEARSMIAQLQQQAAQQARTLKTIQSQHYHTRR